MIVFGSRGSDLASTQTRQVAELVRQRTGADYRIEVIETRGDRELQRPLAEIGVKGLFTAELEGALRERRIDCAVHSLKDLPVEDPDGLTIAAIPQRAASADVLVCHVDAVAVDGSAIPLVHGARIGTSSPRRAGALRRLRPDLELRDIRGNVPTRVERVRRRDYDATVLAAAGLDRLGLDLDGLVRLELSPADSPSAPGQGALAVQCRSSDARTIALLESVHDPESARCVTAERRLLARLGGGCSMPLGAVARTDDGEFELHAALFAVAGRAGGVFRTARGREPDDVVARLALEFEPLVGEPLAGRAVALARPDGVVGELGEYLRVAGADVRPLELVATEGLSPPAALAAALLEPHVLAFTSARAVDAFFALVPAAAHDRIVAIGHATAQAVRRYGRDADVPAGPLGGARLARHVDAHTPRARTVVFPCAESRHHGFETGLEAAGRRVLAVPIYRTVPVAHPTRPIDGEIVVLTSGTVAEAFCALEPRPAASVVAFGERAARALEAAAIEPAAMCGPSPAALLAALLQVKP